MLYKDAKKVGDDEYDCLLQHPVYGWVPFTATSYDTEEHGRLIFKLIQKEFESGGVNNAP